MKRVSAFNELSAGKVERFGGGSFWTLSAPSSGGVFGQCGAFFNGYDFFQEGNFFHWG